MNSEISTSLNIVRTIRAHLAEPDGCRHSIMEIMKQAINFEGLEVTTFQNQNNNGLQSVAGGLIDSAINRQTTN